MNDLVEQSKLKMINEIIYRMKKEGRYTDEQIIEAEKKLKTKLLNDVIITKKINEYGKTSSENVNYTTENLYYDLYTTFKANDELTKIIDEYITMSLFNINNVNSKLDQCIDKLNDFEEMLKTKGNPLIITENFRNNHSFEENKSLYKERYDEDIPISRITSYDFNNSRITLPLTYKINTLMHDNGAKFGSLSIRKQSGKGFINTHTNTDIDNILDTSFKSFWKSSVFSDMPIKVDYSESKPSTPDMLKNYYYDIKHGSILELELNYETICTINNIEISPCTKYPMKLVAIRYTDTDDINSDLKELVYPKNENKYLDSKIMDKTIVYNFEDIICKRLYLIFNQINYERRNFIINTTDVIKNQIWLDVVKDTKDLSIYADKDMLFKPNYLDREISSSYTNKFNKLVLSNSTIKFHDLFYSYKPNYKPIYKNCYEHGFYNISTNLLNYDRFGVYVSSPINILKNIESISIYTDEKHPLASSGNIETDIEYYISYFDDPTYENWIPILPKNTQYVYSELLQLGTDDCILRFPAKKVYSVYMNEVLLKEGVDYFTKFYGTYVNAIEIPGFIHNAMYKVCYEPCEEAHEVKLLDINNIPKTIPSTDIVLGNGGYIYELKDVPYIDNDNSTYVRIIDIETGQVLYQEEFNIFCCTDSTEADKSYKNFFDSETLKYQYYTYDNKIVFNKTIPAAYKIEVSYKHYVSKFRLKTIMRRNNVKDTWLTPVANKIEYHVTVL